jgi:hypothetical protein
MKLFNINLEKNSNILNISNTGKGTGVGAEVPFILEVGQL